MEHAVSQVLLLLVVAALVGIAARRARLPYTLALVVAGVGLGLFHLESLQGLHLTPELLMPVFLPALLFEAAYHVDFARFRRDAGPILLLAVPGVLVAVTVTAAAARGLLGLAGAADFGWPQAVLLAAMIAATDPISVLALFRTLGVDRRLYLLVEGESLLNDGVAVVVFVIVLGVLGLDASAAAPGLDQPGALAVYGLRTFLWMAGVGAASGAILGLVVSVLTRQVDDRLIETALSFVLAYGSFILAERLHASGVLACVAGGMVLGTFGSRYGMSAATRVAVVDFWGFLAFFANSFVFLLVGLELDVPELIGRSGFIALAFLAVLAGRAAAVYGLFPLIRRMRVEPVPPAWAHVLAWGGLRGSLSMVLVVGLPDDFPGRRLLLFLVFGIVSLSLFVQGLTMGGLLRRLGITVDAEERAAYERARARALMAASAERELRRRAAMGLVDPEVQRRLGAYYEARLAEARQEAARVAGARLADERVQETALHLLSIEEDALREAEAEGIVGAEAAETLFLDLAHRREALRHGDDDPEALRAALAEVLGGGTDEAEVPEDAGRPA